MSDETSEIMDDPAGNAMTDVSDPSMEDILASIRKIIADDAPKAPEISGSGDDPAADEEDIRPISTPDTAAGADIFGDLEAEMPAEDLDDILLLDVLDEDASIIEPAESAKTEVAAAIAEPVQAADMSDDLLSALSNDIDLILDESQFSTETAETLSAATVTTSETSIDLPPAPNVSVAPELEALSLEDGLALEAEMSSEADDDLIQDVLNFVSGSSGDMAVSEVMEPDEKPVSETPLGSGEDIEIDIDAALDLGMPDLDAELEAVSETVSEEAAHEETAEIEPVPEIALDEDIDLVKSLIADLTDEGAMEAPSANEPAEATAVDVTEHSSEPASELEAEPVEDRDDLADLVADLVEAVEEQEETPALPLSEEVQFEDEPEPWVLEADETVASTEQEDVAEFLDDLIADTETEEPACEDEIEPQDTSPESSEPEEVPVLETADADDGDVLSEIFDMALADEEALTLTPEHAGIVDEPAPVQDASEVAAPLQVEIAPKPEAEHEPEADPLAASADEAEQAISELTSGALAEFDEDDDLSGAESVDASINALLAIAASAEAESGMPDSLSSVAEVLMEPEAATIETTPAMADAIIAETIGTPALVEAALAPDIANIATIDPEPQLHAQPGVGLAIDALLASTIDPLTDFGDSEEDDLSEKIRPENDFGVEDIAEEVSQMGAAGKTSILDELTSSVTSDAFASLSHAVEQNTDEAHSGPRLGDIVQDALKPMLKEWLDENLKDIVERAVAKEVQRIASGK